MQALSKFRRGDFSEKPQWKPVGRRARLKTPPGAVKWLLYKCKDSEGSREIGLMARYFLSDALLRGKSMHCFIRGCGYGLGGIMRIDFCDASLWLLLLHVYVCLGQLE